MSMIKLVSAFSILFVLGCSSTYKHTELKLPIAKLDPSLGVLISIPDDGWYGEHQYQNSGRMTANA